MSSIRNLTFYLVLHVVESFQGDIVLYHSELPADDGSRPHEAAQCRPHEVAQCRPHESGDAIVAIRCAALLTLQQKEQRVLHISIIYSSHVLCHIIILMKELVEVRPMAFPFFLSWTSRGSTFSRGISANTWR